MSKKKEKKTIQKSKIGVAAKLYFVINALIAVLLIVLGIMQFSHLLTIQNSTGYSMMTPENIATPLILLGCGLVILLMGWIGNIVIATFGKIDKNVATIKKAVDLSTTEADDKHKPENTGVTDGKE